MEYQDPLSAEYIPAWLDNYTPNQRWLNCGKKSHNEQQMKMKFIRLTTEKWLKTIEDRILLPNTKKLTDSATLCHLGVWLEQLNKDPLFSEQWLGQITQLHDELFKIGENAIQAYIDEQHDDAINKLQQLKQVFEKLAMLLENYDNTQST